MKSNILRAGLSGMLLVFLAGWIFIVPAVLHYQLKSEENISTSSIRSSSENPETLEIKMAMALPYSNEWTVEEKSEGLMEYNGEFYTLISKNFKNDTLYFKYLKNNNAREIFGLLADHVDPATGNKDQEAPSESGFGKWLSFKYLPVQIPTVSKTEPVLSETTQIFLYVNFYHGDFGHVSSPPPRFS